MRGIVAALAAPEAIVLIHDYPDRRKYHILERFFVIEDVVDTLVRCRRRPTIDERDSRRLLKYYLYAPDDERACLPSKCRRLLAAIKRLMG